MTQKAAPVNVEVVDDKQRGRRDHTKSKGRKKRAESASE